MAQAWSFCSILMTTMLTMCSCYAQVVPGPDNTTRQEGETNVLIHCPFSISSAPIWLINSTLYEPLSLKPPLLAIATGLNITIVELRYNNTTFQCFIPTGSGLQVEKSPIGILTVTKKDGYIPPKAELVPQIVLDHQKIYFNATHRIIGWNFENNQSCTPPVTFTLDLLMCNSDVPVQTWTTQNIELTIQSVQQKDESMYFRISASDKDLVKCPVTTANFQVPSDPYAYSNELSIPLGEAQCLEVPKIAKQQSLYAVWPRDDGTDCICPLCDDGKCVLSNCECYNTSMFQPELKINDSGSTALYSLCWSNLISDRNNSRIFFFYEELSCLDNDKSPFLSRKYDENSVFLLRGPPLPPALNVSAPNVICFNSYSYYPIDNFTIRVSDLTGEVQTVNQSSKPNNIRTCFSLSEDTFPEECSPYEVTVVAHNKVGFSNASNVTLQETKGDFCSCMERKIDIELSLSEITESSVKISVNCTELLPSNIKEFSIKVTDSKSTSSQNVSFPCLSDVHFENLIPNTTFNITVVWFDLSLPTECNFEEFTTLPGFPPAPLLKTNVTRDTVCFLSNAYYPVAYYTIDLTDLIGENHSVTVNVSNSSSNETQACIFLHEAAFPSECSPYNVSVRAHNKVGSSNTSATMFRENRGGDVCSCMDHKIDIELSESDVTDSSLQINVNCTELLPSKFKNFAIKVIDTMFSQNVSCPCLADLHITNLMPSTTFNITVVWLDFVQPVECYVEEFTTLSGFPPAPLLNIAGDTVCFLSNAYYPVTYYTVNLTDLMSEIYSVTVNVSNPSSNETQACISLYEVAFLSECSPYNVSVRAHNKIGSSNISKRDTGEDNNMTLCSCMEDKVSLDISPHTITDSSIQLYGNCTENLLQPSTEIIHIIIELKSDEISYNNSMDCRSMLSVLEFDKLKSSTTYNMTVIWFLRSSDLEQAIACPNFENITTCTDQHSWTVTIILSSVLPGSVLITASIVILILGIIIYLKRRRQGVEERYNNIPQGQRIQ